MDNKKFLRFFFFYVFTRFENTDRFRVKLDISIT